MCPMRTSSLEIQNHRKLGFQLCKIYSTLSLHISYPQHLQVCFAGHFLGLGWVYITQQYQLPQSNCLFDTEHYMISLISSKLQDWGGYCWSNDKPRGELFYQKCSPLCPYDHIYVNFLSSDTDSAIWHFSVKMAGGNDLCFTHCSKSIQSNLIEFYQIQIRIKPILLQIFFHSISSSPKAKVSSLADTN